MDRWGRGDFVRGHAVALKDYKDYLALEGEICCLGMIVIKVVKHLYYVDGDNELDPQIYTAMYCYNASVHNQHPIFRYDNQHIHDGHESVNHLHVFDWQTGEEADLIHTGENWPTLNDVIQKAYDWYQENKSHLPYPDAWKEDPSSDVY